MADSLNAMRGPTRSVAKWKDTLAAWKNQLRCRARKVHVDVTGTGGGPRTADTSDFDQQALETFGAATVYGRANMGTFGHEEPLCSSQLDITETDLIESDVIQTEVVNSSELVTCESSAPLSAPQNPNSEAAALNDLLTVPPGVTGCNPRARTSQTVTSLNAALNSLQIKDEREASQHEVLIATLHQLSTAVNQMTVVLEKLNAKLDQYPIIYP
ncbi:PREDICTED: uncharacterized protein LOC108361148 [Rhagoletis zephyria]|uniref:uncharacterized protein LOC108361148 n=1 Tax=Rhagoletis zephyria TaxID=28612 RepID=UPI0008116215|nr:PREDICTED: uncharacterized protein LOC108361148 [Rhagoletis zephyria]